MSKRGTLYIDDRAYEATDEMLEYFDRVMHRNDYGNWSEQYKGKLLNGENVHYYSDSNTVDKPVDVGSDGKNPYVAGIPTWKQRLHATVNSKRNKYQTWLYGLAGFNYAPKTDTENTDDSTSSTPIGAENLSFKYKVNEDGSKTYLADDSNNIAIAKRLDDWRNWYGLDEEGRKKYDTTAWGTSGTDKIINLFKNYDTLDENNNVVLDNRIKEIRERATKDQLTDEDWAFLENLNIVPESSAATTQAALDAQTKRELDAMRNTWTTAGYGDYFDALRDVYDLNNDYLTLKAGEADPYSDLGNMYFNDDFYTTTKAADGKYDALKGLTLYNGRFYNINSPTLAKILNSKSGFNEQKRSGNWEAAEGIIKTLHSLDPLGAPAGMPGDIHSEFFAQHPRYFYSANTGYQGLTDPNNIYDSKGNKIKVDDTMQIVRYYDMDSPTSDGPYTTYANKYALLDEYGNFITNLDENAVKQLEPSDKGYDPKRGFTARQRVQSDDFNFDNHYVDSPVGQNKTWSGVTTFKDLGGKNDILYLDGFSTHNAWMGKKRPRTIGRVGIRLPDVLKVAFENNKNWKEVISDSNKFVQLKEALSLIFSSVSADVLGTKTPNGRRIKVLLKDLGFNDIDIANILNWYWTNDRQTRMRFLISNVPYINKNNGKVEDEPVETSTETPSEETPAMKHGGILKFEYGGSNAQHGITESATNVNSYNQAGNARKLNASYIRDLFKGTLSDEETADTVAAFADLAALAGAFTPLSTPTALLGATGSVARYQANRERNTKGAGWQLAGDLGMDALGAIPILNIFTRSAKAAKAVSFLMKLAATYGMSSGTINAIEKLGSGNFTMRDLDAVFNSFAGAAAFRRLGGLGKTAKTTSKIENVEIQGKKPVRNQEAITVEGKTDATPNVNLTKEDLANVKTEDDLIALLQQKTKSGETVLTSDKIKELYKIDEATGKLVPEPATPEKITLTEAELKNAKNQADLEEAFLKKAKEVDPELARISDKAEALTAAKAKYDLDAVLTKSQSKVKNPDRKWYSIKDRRKTVETTSWSPEISKTEEALTPTGKTLSDWWHKTGPRQQAYRDKPYSFSKEEPPAVGTSPVEPTRPALTSTPELTPLREEPRVIPNRSRRKGEKQGSWTDFQQRRKASLEEHQKWEKEKVEYEKAKQENETAAASNAAKETEFNNAHREWETQHKAFEARQKAHSEWENEKAAYERYRQQYFEPHLTWVWADSNRGTQEWNNDEVAYNPYRKYRPIIAFNKAGGKIKKLYFGGFPGIQFNGDSLAASVSATNAASNNWLQGYKNQVASFGKTPSYLDNLGKMEYTWGTNANNKVTITPTFKSPTPAWKQNFWYAKPGTAVTNDEDKPINLSGGNNERAFDINKAGIALGNTIGAISSANASRKQLDVTTGVPPLMQKSVTYPVPPIISNGVGEAYFNAAKEIGNVKDTSSNAITNNIQHQTRDESREKLNLSGNLEVSKNLSDILNKQYSTALKQGIANTETFNKNAESWFAKRTNDAAQKAAHYAQLQSIKNNALIGNLKLFDEWSSNFIKDRNAPTYQEELLSLTNDYKAKLNGLSANSPEAVLLMDQFKMDRDELARKYRMSEASYKKGGKVSKMSYAKDITADLLLQSNKDTQAFLRKLSENTQRLLLQITKK